MQDKDPIETREWLDALASVVEHEGPERAQFLIKALLRQARKENVPLPTKFNTPYMNTISPEEGAHFPGDKTIERRIQALIRWNAMAMVVRAGKKAPEVGGHIATFASAATLYDVGFNHFFRAPSAEHGGDLLYIQGHSSPGIYARAFLEGRLTEAQLEGFRQEVAGGGLSSYPHPWLMPDFWQFPTVSMGLGPIQAIYQARFMKYMQNRELLEKQPRKVWCFCGDGEMDEPESLGAITLAGRENLDNLVFVINCNLQRLDGPVRGNGKIIQELEGVFAGAGWNVVKVVWGRHWDPLITRDDSGVLLRRMEEATDGDYQAYKANDGAYVREHFFNKYPETAALVSDMTDGQIWRLNRGGHDVHKVYAAYDAAVKHTGQPTVILAKTIKGYGMGAAGEAQNITHQRKKMDTEEIRAFRDRFSIPIPDDKLEDVPFYRPADDSAEVQYMKAHREALGGSLPARRQRSDTTLPVPALSNFEPVLAGSGEREISTTMAWVRLLSILLKDKKIKDHIVPIVPDESRTFGMEGLFRQIGIYSPLGQLYEPEDKHLLMYYREDIKGQILEEGITEAGAFCSWMAAGSSYSSHNVPMIPFYIYYSMFGFQRIGDLAWAAGDMQVRGFLLGATSGRTTLAGEGLQHQDGHSHILASTIPNCVAYDPTFGYEVAVITQEGLRRMMGEQENVFYYMTLMNDNYHQPAMPKGVEKGILKGLYLFKKAGKHKLQAQLLGCGAILPQVIEAAKILEEDYQVACAIWSATSFNELRKEALSIARWNHLHPEKDPKTPYVTQCLANTKGPVIAATDYMRAFSDQIREFLPDKHYVTLGTDGYGRSDSRAQLRHFFEVDPPHIAYAVLKALSDAGEVPLKTLKAAMKALNIDPKKPDPVSV